LARIAESAAWSAQTGRVQWSRGSTARGRRAAAHLVGCSGGAGLKGRALVGAAECLLPASVGEVHNGHELLQAAATARTGILLAMLLGILTGLLMTKSLMRP
jgi:hypothetical protein